MRRTISLIIGAAALFLGFGASPALADNGPHQSTAVTNGTTGALIANAGATRCAGCHRAHTAQGSYLLKDSGAGLCETCHAGAGASTDVMHGLDVSAGGALRGGGFTTAQLGAHTATKNVSDGTGADPYLALYPNYLVNGARPSATVSAGRGFGQNIPVVVAEATTSKHNIDAVGTIWGSGAISATANYGKSVTLECTSCHDPHGNKSYRILKPIPQDSGATAGVTVPDAAAKVYTTTNYWLTADANVPNQNVSVTNATTGAVTTYSVDGFTANIAQWCTQCHTRYLAPSGSYKTSSGDAVFMYRHRSDNNTKPYATPNCITCHVAHGSNATMKGTAAQVALPDGSNGNSATDSRLLRVDDRGACVLCHNV